MADQSRGPGQKRQIPKTFGDVMKGIPAGKGGGEGRPPAPEQGERPRQGAPAPEAAPPAAAPRADKPRHEKHRRTDEVKKGPVVVRKPAPLVGKREEAAAPPAAAAPAPSEGASVAAPPAPEGHAAEHAQAPAEHRPEPHAEPRGESHPQGRGRHEPKRPPKTVFRRADGLNLPPREAEGEKALAAPSAELPPDAPVENFAEMFAQSEKQVSPKRFEVGQKVSGRIVQIGQESAFLDLGGKGEGMIDLAELKDTHGNLIVSIGEILEGYVLALTGDHGGIVVTKALSKGAQRDFLAEAGASGIPVEGLVAAHNKGGLEIDLGGIRGFCPSSQIGLHFVEDPGALVGQRLTFKVIEVKDRDVVLSRRALLEEEAKKQAEETRKNLFPGAQVEGVVTSLREYGAFVDLGGIEGLIHVSELGYGRIAHPKDVLKVGQKVRVEVRRVESAKEGEKADRIALSMKALQQDPWQEAAATLHEGQQVKGRVARLQPFGAFVEILPGVDGLVHISALGANRRIAHPKEVVNEGDEVTCVIDSIDVEQKRISLRRVVEGEAGAVEAAPAAAERPARPTGAPAQVGDVLEVTVDKIEPFGIFVRWPTGRGLVPNVEVGTPKGQDHRKLFPVGSTFKASVLEIDSQGRYRMSKRGAEEAEERAEYRQFMKQQKGASGGSKGFGTLGDLLKLKK